MTIPSDWSYEPDTNLPLGWIVEGTNSYQCACPSCKYGEGYLETISGSWSNIKPVVCETCGLEFLALYL